MRFKLQKLIKTAFLLIAVFATSCTESFDSPSQYSNVGFDKGRRPEDATSTIPSVHPVTKTIEEAKPGYYSDGNMDFTNQSVKEAISSYKSGNVQQRQPSPPQYQQQPYYQQPYYPQQYQQPYYYQQAPQGYYAQPYAVPAYQPQVVPASRFYNNPYAIPPANQAPQYYDSDQYYTPPTYYRSDAAQSSMQRQQ